MLVYFGLKYDKKHSLSHSEGERKVVAALLGRQLGVVECVRVEVVDQCAERQSVRPCRREVGYLNVLQT